MIGQLIMAALVILLERFVSQKRRDRKFARKHRYM